MVGCFEWKPVISIILSHLISTSGWWLFLLISAQAWNGLKRLSGTVRRVSLLIRASCQLLFVPSADFCNFDWLHDQVIGFWYHIVYVQSHAGWAISTRSAITAADSISRVHNSIPLELFTSHGNTICVQKLRRRLHSRAFVWSAAGFEYFLFVCTFSPSQWRQSCAISALLFGRNPTIY